MAKARPLEDQSKEELIEYIRGTLNPREKETREALEQYQSAFVGLDPAEQQGVLHLVRTMQEDPQTGAEMFIEFGNMILGNDTDTDTTTPRKETTDMSDKTEEAPAWAQALIAEVAELKAAQSSVMQNTEAQEIAAYKAEARKLGYVEGTDDWVTFFKIAASDIADGDLAQAHDIFTKLYGVPTDESENVEEGESDEAVEEAAAASNTSTPTPKFPATAGAGGAGSPKASETADPLPMTKEAVAERAKAFIAQRTEPAPAVAP